MGSAPTFMGLTAAYPAKFQEKIFVHEAEEMAWSVKCLVLKCKEFDGSPRIYIKSQAQHVPIIPALGLGTGTRGFLELAADHSS